MKKVLSVITVLAIIASFCVGVMAADTVKQITAEIDYNIKMKVDNVEWNPTEADGSAIRPITYNGRTYLPVRALGEKLGIAIDWDEETWTVLIGEKEWTPLSALQVETFNDMGYTKDPDKLYNGNGTYDFGCFVSQQWIGNQFSDIEINTANKYSTMKMGMYCSGSDKEVTITDKESGEVLKQVTLRDGVSTNVEFGVTGVQNVVIKWSGNDETDVLIFGDIYMK